MKNRMILILSLIERKLQRENSIAGYENMTPTKWTKSFIATDKDVLKRVLAKLDELGVPGGVLTDEIRKELEMYPYAPMKSMGNIAGYAKGLNDRS